MNDLSCSHKGHLWKSLFCRIYEALKTRQRFLRTSTMQKHQPPLFHSLLELFYCTRRQIFDGLDLDLFKQSRPEECPFVSDLCYMVSEKQRWLPLYISSIFASRGNVSIALFFRGHTQGQVLFPYSFLHSVWIHDTIHSFVCFKALESAREDAVVKAIPANSYLSMAGNTDLSHFNYTSNLVQYHKPWR